jgi:aerobic carbon-monoxide dehydrogenase small subunit
MGEQRNRSLHKTVVMSNPAEQIPVSVNVAVIEMSTREDVPVSITVNDHVQQIAVAPHLLLVDLLRDRLGLTGTKVGCETGQCGACTILVDGVAVKSCAILAAQMDGCHVTTIEGLSHDGLLTPIQTALWEKHGVQCGFCTPGIVLSLTDFLGGNPNPSEGQIKERLDGNLCRCGVYQNVIRAVQSVVETRGNGA